MSKTLGYRCNLVVYELFTMGFSGKKMKIIRSVFRTLYDEFGNLSKKIRFYHRKDTLPLALYLSFGGFRSQAVGFLVTFCRCSLDNSLLTIPFICTMCIKILPVFVARKPKTNVYRIVDISF